MTTGDSLARRAPATRILLGERPERPEIGEIRREVAKRPEMPALRVPGVLERFAVLDAEVAKARGGIPVEPGAPARERARVGRLSGAVGAEAPFRDEREELPLEKPKPRVTRLARLEHEPSHGWSEVGALRFHDERKIPADGEAAAKPRLNFFGDGGAVGFHVERTSFRPEDERLKWNDDENESRMERH